MTHVSSAWAPFSFVIAGLVPAIHVFASLRSARRGCVDARSKSGHDVSECTVTESEQGRIER
jgi:hypothetical protein